MSDVKSYFLVMTKYAIIPDNGHVYLALTSVVILHWRPAVGWSQIVTHAYM